MSYRTRFAPSPTGYLHLGHAYSALVAARRAEARDGLFLLRIEDLDHARVRPEYEAAIYEDLAWLGLDWPRPVIRQSERGARYRDALGRLGARGLIYPCRCTRGDIRAALSAPQEGADRTAGPAVYPGTCRQRPMGEARAGDAIRLDLARAFDALRGTGALTFHETGPLHGGPHRVQADRLRRQTGDIVLARRDIGAASYHLAVVVDDAAQRITEVVRGEDLFEATAIHVLLQALLEMPTPEYHHHRLIRDETGKRLAKRDDARAVRTLRAAGLSARDVLARVGL